MEAGQSREAPLRRDGKKGSALRYEGAETPEQFQSSGLGERL
jgi:hypothetical protein